MNRPATLEIAFALTTSLVMPAVAEVYDARIDKVAEMYEAKVIAWRHDIHQNPELSNREFRAAKLIAEHLKSLKFDEVKTEIRRHRDLVCLAMAHDARNASPLLDSLNAASAAKRGMTVTADAIWRAS